MCQDKDFLTIGFVTTCMSEFDAVLDVADVRESEIPDITDPEYVGPMRGYLGEFGRVVNAGVVGDVPGAEAAARFFKEQETDVLVIHEFAFTLSSTINALIKGLDAPIIFWNTQKQRHMDEKTDFSIVMANNSVSTIPHSTNLLFQAGRQDYWVVTGSEADEHTSTRFAELFCAVSAKKRLAKSKIASIGYVYPGMHTLSVNEEKFSSVFGVSVDRLNPAEIRKYYRNADDDRVVDALEELKRQYVVEGLSADELARSARFEVAFRNYAADKKITAFALLCGLLIQDDEMGVAPCYALSKLSAEGIHSSCECDIPSAAALIVAQELAGDAHFTEFYMMDMDREIILMCHCGYGNCALANEKYPVKIVPQPCFPGPRGSGAAFEFSIKPGVATILSITDSPSGYKLVSILADCLDVAAYPSACPQAVIRFRDHSMTGGVERYCKAGGSHHMVICSGDITGSLGILAQLIGIDYERI